MGKMFSKMMEGCMKGVSEEDKKAMKEKMMAFCGSKMEKMSDCFKKAGSQPCCPSSTPEKT